MFVRYELTTLGDCEAKLKIVLNFRSKLCGRAARQMARVDTIGKYPYKVKYTDEF